MHTGITPFSCSTCDKKFIKSSHLEVHERVHTGSNLFCCSYCDKTFVKSTSLKAHEMFHSGDMPFQCSFCDKKYTTRRSLERHKTVHLKDKLAKTSEVESIKNVLVTLDGTLHSKFIFIQSIRFLLSIVKTRLPSFIAIID